MFVWYFIYLSIVFTTSNKNPGNLNWCINIFVWFLGFPIPGVEAVEYRLLIVSLNYRMKFSLHSFSYLSYWPIFVSNNVIPFFSWTMWQSSRLPVLGLRFNRTHAIEGRLRKHPHPSTVQLWFTTFYKLAHFFKFFFKLKFYNIVKKKKWKLHRLH